MFSFFKKKYKKKHSNEHDVADDSLFLFTNDEFTIKKAKEYMVQIEYKAKILSKQKYSMGANFLFTYGGLLFDLEKYFSMNIASTYSLLVAIKKAETKEEQMKFNTYLDLLFTYLFNFNEYALQFFNHLFELKLAETRQQEREIRNHRDILKSRLPELEQELEDADTDRGFELENYIRIAKLTNEEIKTLTLHNFKKRVEEKYALDPILVFLFEELNGINEYKGIRNTISHRSSLSFTTLSGNYNPYLNHKVFNHSSNLSYQNLFGEIPSNQLTMGDTISNDDVLEICKEIIDYEKNILNIMNTYLGGYSYPVNKENCGAKYYLAYYQCVDCKDIRYDGKLSFKKNSILANFPKYLNNSYCLKCLKEIPKKRFYLAEVTEYFYNYEIGSLEIKNLNEVCLQCKLSQNKLLYYSQFITLYSYSVDLQNYLREDNYKKLYNK